MSLALYILVFIHGFKGGSDTFDSFPGRLAHSIGATLPGTTVESIVYPAYDTRGELVTAVDNHLTWLTETVVTRQAEFVKNGGDRENVKVVLLGHSMGGLVIADAFLSVRPSPENPTPWPKIVGLIAYDTPYFGLNPMVFSNTASKVLDHVGEMQAGLAALGAGWGYLSGRNAKPEDKKKAEDKSRGTSTSTAVAPAPSGAAAKPATGWGSYGLYAAGAALVAGAGAAYVNREKLTSSWSWATSHLSFVGELWKTERLDKRMEEVAQSGVGFRCFYTLLPPAKGPARSFIVLPHSGHALSPSFIANTNTKADDEIGAHVDMFNKSDGMFTLAQESSAVIVEWLRR